MADRNSASGVGSGRGEPSRGSVAAMMRQALILVVAGVVAGALATGLGTMAAEAFARMEGEARGGILRWSGALLWGLLNVAAVAPGAFAEGALIGVCVGGACALMVLLAAIFGRVSAAPPPQRWTILPALAVAGAVGSGLEAGWQAAEPLAWYVAGGALFGLVAGYAMDRPRREVAEADLREQAATVRGGARRPCPERDARF